MNLLLDTHALLWWWSDDPRLPASARALIADPAAQVHVSAASAWEIATKHRIGKLPEGAEAVAKFQALTLRNGFIHLPIAWQHALRAGAYTATHCDPFDRLLAAQADLERLALVTRDPAFAAFGTQVRW